jgi:hypothetical protein
MSMRRLLICVLLLVTACQPDRSSQTPAGPPSTDVRILIGRWTVTGSGVPTGTKLLMRDAGSGKGEAFIDLPCGRSGAQWATAGEQSLFLGVIEGWASRCNTRTGPSGLDWLKQAVAFRSKAGGVTLLGPDGRALATLKAIPPSLKEPRELPLTPPDKKYDAPAAMTSAARAPTLRDVLGRWVQTSPAKARQPVEFGSDGLWHSGVGCGAQSGYFRLGSDGRLLATEPRIFAAMICASRTPPAIALGQVSRLGLIGSELAFYDRAGKELARAKRSTTGTVVKALVGRWAVTATGVPRTSVLVLRTGRSSDEGWSVHLQCGSQGGSWEADAEQGLFVAVPSAGTGNCMKYPEVTLGWISHAKAFRVEGTRRLLLDERGRTLAVLRPAGPGTGTQQMTTGDLDPQSFANAVPLPEGVVPPTPTELARRWVPVDAAPAAKSFLSFDLVGMWQGHDGCHPGYGSYVLGEGGRLLAVGGTVSLLSGCSFSSPGMTSDLVEQATRSSRLGLIKGQLVLYDVNGAEIARAVAA